MRPNPIQSDPCKLVSRISVSESASVGLSSVGITRSDCIIISIIVTFTYGERNETETEYTLDINLSD